MGCKVKVDSNLLGFSLSSRLSELEHPMSSQQSKSSCQLICHGVRVASLEHNCQQML